MLTSRLFILSVILSRMRGLRAFVFVETAGHIRRRFVGVCDSDAVHWQLASRFPWFEAALAHAEAAVWPPLSRGVVDQLPGLTLAISDRGCYGCGTPGDDDGADDGQSGEDEYRHEAILHQLLPSFCFSLADSRRLQRMAGRQGDVTP